MAEFIKCSNFSVESGSPDALLWLEGGQRLWKKAHKFQRSFQDGEDGYFHFKGLSKKPVKALSFPYLCEKPSYFDPNQFMMSTKKGNFTNGILLVLLGPTKMAEEPFHEAK